ncbi:nucleotide 5'-monophosphate nucleosidase PpnN [Pasteurellaceae bacterium TAE3-ERU1]|nr:nucleotide 5'-monophosphate nucleosidase PpnN [Pasteurellaceae bacterium TAE3-ERU1]
MSSHIINPRGSMDQLSHLEVELLQKGAAGNLYPLYRNCSLAVLNSGSVTDDSRILLAKYADFEIELIARERGISLWLINPPEDAFVDNKLIRNIQYHLFAVLRDILFVNVITKHNSNGVCGSNANKITNYIFTILRNAKALIVGESPNLVVCWGGHSIGDVEYAYCRAVGLQLGLRELNIVTGCGPGVMEAPMKGAAIGHANQRFKNSRFIGITEPSIIASEPPNPIVNELIIMPDIEKRLEAFVRMGHSIVVFPGGPGTFEELLYILGIKLNPANKDIPLPLYLTGPKESADYFATIDRFIGDVFGPEVQSLYEIIIDDPVKLAREVSRNMGKIQNARAQSNDSYGFNWRLDIAEAFQQPFEPTHENMSGLDLHLEQSKADLAANLRRAFSGIVAGNIKPDYIEKVEQLGPYELHGDPMLLEKMDQVLKDFITQDRMKLPGGDAYQPCYKIMK